jgi:hypothetical protein
MSVLRVLTALLASQQGPRVVAMGLALFASGCASQQSAQTESVAQATGMVSQPSSTQRDLPDAAAEEAKEPWSPNYGWQPRTRDFGPSYAPIPVDRVIGTTRYATMDPDAVIRHAVAAHEMRRQ